MILVDILLFICFDGLISLLAVFYLDVMTRMMARCFFGSFFHRSHEKTNIQVSEPTCTSVVDECINHKPWERWEKV